MPNIQHIYVRIIKRKRFDKRNRPISIFFTQNHRENSENGSIVGKIDRSKETAVVAQEMNTLR